MCSEVEACSPVFDTPVAFVALAAATTYDNLTTVHEPYILLTDARHTMSARTNLEALLEQATAQLADVVAPVVETADGVDLASGFSPDAQAPLTAAGVGPCQQVDFAVSALLARRELYAGNLLLSRPPACELMPVFNRLRVEGGIVLRCDFISIDYAGKAGDLLSAQCS